MPRVRRKHQKIFWTVLIAGTFVIILNEVLNTSNVQLSSVVTFRRIDNNLTFQKYIEGEVNDFFVHFRGDEFLLF